MGDSNGVTLYTADECFRPSRFPLDTYALHGHKSHAVVYTLDGPAPPEDDGLPAEQRVPAHRPADKHYDALNEAARPTTVVDPSIAYMTGGLTILGNSTFLAGRTVDTARLPPLKHFARFQLESAPASATALPLVQKVMAASPIESLHAVTLPPAHLRHTHLETLRTVASRFREAGAAVRRKAAQIDHTLSAIRAYLPVTIVRLVSPDTALDTDLIEGLDPRIGRLQRNLCTSGMHFTYATPFGALALENRPFFSPADVTTLYRRYLEAEVFRILYDSTRRPDMAATLDEKVGNELVITDVISGASISVTLTLEPQPDVSIFVSSTASRNSLIHTNMDSLSIFPADFDFSFLDNAEINGALLRGKGNIIELEGAATRMASEVTGIREAYLRPRLAISSALPGVNLDLVLVSCCSAFYANTFHGGRYSLRDTFIQLMRNLHACTVFLRAGYYIDIKQSHPHSICLVRGGSSGESAAYTARSIFLEEGEIVE